LPTAFARGVLQRDYTHSASFDRNAADWVDLHRSTQALCGTVLRIVFRFPNRLAAASISQVEFAAHPKPHAGVGN